MKPVGGVAPSSSVTARRAKTKVDHRNSPSGYLHNFRKHALEILLLLAVALTHQLAHIHGQSGPLGPPHEDGGAETTDETVTVEMRTMFSARGRVGRCRAVLHVQRAGPCTVIQDPTPA